MKAAVLRQLGRLDIEDVALNGPRADEVRVRVLASGLCHSDYHAIMGDLPSPMPAVLGHEGAGVVEAIGADVHGIAVGDLVVTCISAFCGGCSECQRGRTHLCDDKPDRPEGAANARLSRDGEPLTQFAKLGAFAEEMVVHHRSVSKMPEGIPAASAALLGCAVLTGVGAVLNGARVEAGASVAVIGCGGVGLNAVQGARIAGASKIIAVDLNPDKLELAKAFGATHTVLAGPDSVAQVIDLTNGGVDYAFEVIGLPATMRDACMMLRKRGTAVLVGIAKMGAELAVPIMPFAFKEIRVMGSMMGSSPFQLFLPQLAQHYLSGGLKLDELVSEHIALEDINEGYARMAAGKVARSVITFD
jgi:S-(hydroxymethyl)glutathione dehydrogenase / alcohol dehydrogenase